MSASDLDLARRFVRALEAAAKTGNREGVYPFLADDVEWVTPYMSLNGIEHLQKELIWGYPPEKLDIEFENGQTTDLGDGRIVTNVREVWRMRNTGKLAYARKRRFDLTVRQGEISRYEMRVVG